jgi:hypothetical protein
MSVDSTVPSIFECRLTVCMAYTGLLYRSRSLNFFCWQLSFDVLLVVRAVFQQVIKRIVPPVGINDPSTPRLSAIVLNSLECVIARKATRNCLVQTGHLEPKIHQPRRGLRVYKKPATCSRDSLYIFWRVFFHSMRPEISAGPMPQHPPTMHTPELIAHSVAYRASSTGSKGLNPQPVRSHSPDQSAQPQCNAMSQGPDSGRLEREKEKERQHTVVWVSPEWACPARGAHSRERWAGRCQGSVVDIDTDDGWVRRESWDRLCEGPPFLRLRRATDRHLQL